MDKNDILKALFEKDRSFNELVDVCKGNKNTMRKRLADLLEEGLIEDKTTNWELGKRKWYALTHKGQLKFSKDATVQFYKCFEDIDFIINKIFDNPTLLAAFRKQLQKDQNNSSCPQGSKPIKTEDDSYDKERVKEAIATFKDAFLNFASLQPYPTEYPNAIATFKDAFLNLDLALRTTTSTFACDNGNT